uniref:Ig-like domain-containing protein n=1 Tax=Vespula pensylvanica TaxID=30213 RepID=A0A834P330_VESPE|nr:hypothetical protein H0235_007992 [Vespula pensylvanica]
MEAKTALKYNVPHVMRQARKNENKKKLETRDALSFDIVSQVTASDTTSVTLVDVSRNLTGTYKCEVSAGVPSYHTLIERAKMMVVDAPKTDPTIGSEKERIAVGEMLRANCTSGASRPASAITWMLNGDHITNNSSHFWIQPHSISQEDDTVKTKSHIEFKITNDMFQNGRLHLRCIAFISDVYRKSADMEIAVDEPLLASITGDAPAHSHTLRWAIKNKLHSESALLDSLGMNNTDILKKTCSKPKKQLRCTDDDNGAAIKIGMKTTRKDSATTFPTLLLTDGSARTGGSLEYRRNSETKVKQKRQAVDIVGREVREIGAASRGQLLSLSENDSDDKDSRQFLGGIFEFSKSLTRS